MSKPVKMEIEIDGFTGGVNRAVNVEFGKDTFRKRRGWRTFAEMVEVLWQINKKNKKFGFKGDYTVRLPLKGYKPVYKRTLENE